MQSSEQRKLKTGFAVFFSSSNQIPRIRIDHCLCFDWSIKNSSPSMPRTCRCQSVSQNNAANLFFYSFGLIATNLVSEDDIVACSRSFSLSTDTQLESKRYWWDILSKKWYKKERERERKNKSKIPKEWRSTKCRKQSFVESITINACNKQDIDENWRNTQNQSNENVVVPYGENSCWYLACRSLSSFDQKTINKHEKWRKVKKSIDLCHHILLKSNPNQSTK